MRRRDLFLAFPPLAAWALTAAACDSIDVGRAVDPEGGPVLWRILIQDEDPRGGRYLATDLLNKNPVRRCSESSPCAAGDPPCAIAPGASEGVCPDPLNLRETPPAIGALTPFTTGGNQIRLVFNQLLAPDIAVALEDRPDDFVRLVGPDGNALGARIYFDPTGSFGGTSDFVLAPYGPAIVLKNEAPFSASTTYEIGLEPDRIRNRRGEALSEDINGDPVSNRYVFETEGLYAVYVAPDVVADPEASLATNQVILVESNAHLDLDPTVTSTAVDVRSSDGRRISASAFAPCDAPPRFFAIARTSSSGAPLPWSPGTYHLRATLPGDNGRARLRYDAGGTPFEGDFEVTSETLDPAQRDDVIESVARWSVCE